VSRGTQEPASSPVRFRLRGYHALRPRFPAGSASGRIGNSTVAGPTTSRAPQAGPGIWAVPISLATTLGIEVSFFSSGY
jgi:hypothetical protein